MDFDQTINRLSQLSNIKPQQSGNGYKCVCPAHKDDTPSLQVTKTADGKTLLYCFAGCSYADIMAVLDDPTTPRRTITPKKDAIPWYKRAIVKTYPYTDAAGVVLYEKIRFDPKFFMIGRRIVENKPISLDNVTWGMGDITPVLYNLPAVLAAKTVFIVEGEKDADLLNSLGLTATTNFDGCGNRKWLSHYNDAFIGKNVAIIPDNDKPGRKFSVQIAASLVGVALTIVILQLPGLSYKQDVSDWVELGYTREDLQALRTKALLNLV